MPGAQTAEQGRGTQCNYCKPKRSQTRMKHCRILPMRQSK
jgi:hypothetical protein